ncbi:hypothetical protein ScPMuIL_004479 [Solemya velum]
MGNLSVVLVMACFAFATAQMASSKRTCTVSSDCQQGECCFKSPRYPIMSRKRQLPVMATEAKTGSCESYKNEGNPCSPLETLNGHCGCGDGLGCSFVPEPPVASRRTVRRIFMPGPGSYMCQRQAPLAS